MQTENLSVTLFKPQGNTIETSTLIKTLDNTEKRPYKDSKTGCGWYRVLRRPQWIWMGVDPIEQEAILARIAANENNHPRSNENLLDTVCGYVPGNWIYEWSRAGMQYQHHANDALNLGDYISARDSYMQASCYFSVAAYPSIRGDRASMHADTLAHKAYVHALNLMPEQIKEIKFTHQKKELVAHLYLPNKEIETPLPTIIFCGGLDILQPEIWRLYKDYIAQQNWALISLDLPALGQCQGFSLTENSSAIHQSLLEQLSNYKELDTDLIFGMGVRLGANMITRLALIKPEYFKGVVSLGGIFHDLLANPNRWQKKIPDMYLDVMATIVGKNSFVTSAMLNQLNSWSLKTQGLLGAPSKSRVPLLGLALKNDTVSPISDNRLLARSSMQGSYEILEDKPLYSGYHRLLTNAISWINSQLK